MFVEPFTSEAARWSHLVERKRIEPVEEIADDDPARGHGTTIVERLPRLFGQQVERHVAGADIIPGHAFAAMDRDVGDAPQVHEGIVSREEQLLSQWYQGSALASQRDILRAEVANHGDPAERGDGGPAADLGGEPFLRLVEDRVAVGCDQIDVPTLQQISTGRS